ncbi:MAG: putative peptidase, rane zinc metallopeptidase [Gammaproteobacteria bacterium]|nr:putative peptidase, rane zinc metallopeptidase [Gammaproteobacteria bacterium]
MLLALTLIILIIVLFGPQLWAGHVLKRYNTRIDELPGTGGELAEHLLKRYALDGVNVEKSEQKNDHYNPEEKTIMLAEDIYDGKSLTAVVVTAHEVGHAIQHKMGHRPFFLRWRLARFIAYTEKLASIILIVFPFAATLTRMPGVGAIILLVGIALMLLPVVFHLITLPVEWDASFKRALPILIEGEYIPQSAIPVARKILTAAALTYVAASLASVLNFYRWIAILRR